MLKNIFNVVYDYSVKNQQQIVNSVNFLSV
jgi:hypothetical protein